MITDRPFAIWMKRPPRGERGAVLTIEVKLCSSNPTDSNRTVYIIRAVGDIGAGLSPPATRPYAAQRTPRPGCLVRPKATLACPLKVADEPRKGARIRKGPLARMSWPPNAVSVAQDAGPCSRTGVLPAICLSGELGKYVVLAVAKAVRVSGSADLVLGLECAFMPTTYECELKFQRKTSPF